MADGLQILANLDVKGSTKQFNKDLKEIAKNLKAIGSPEFVAKLDVTKSQKEIQKELNTISKNLTIQLTPKINPPKSTGGGSNSIPSMAGQLFNTSDLDKAGVKYFKQVDDIVNRVKKEYSKLGDKTDVQLFKNAKGQIESFAVTLNKTGNVIEKFNFERAKLDTGSGKIAGFVQNKSSLSDKMSGTELQKTIAYMDTIEKQLRSINSNALNVSSPIKEGTKAYEQYNNKLQTTVSRITEIREANKILSVENKREINQIMLSLQEYVGSIKNSSKMNKSIFDTAQLDKDGVKYYQKVSNLFEVIKKDFASMGEASISATKNAKGQVDNLTVSVKKANGELEKFNFIKAKLNTGSTKVTGFVQDKSILGSNSKDLQSTVGFLNQIEKQLVRIDNEALHKRNPLKEDTKYYNDYIAQLNDTRTQIDNIAKSSQVLSFQQREAIKKLVFELDQYTSKKKVEANVSVLPTQNVDNSKKIALEQLTAMESKYKNVTYATKELQSQYDALRVSLTQLRPLLNSVTDNEGFKDYSAQVQKLKAEFTAFNNNVRSSNAIDNVAQRAQVLAQRINTYIATNNNATKIYGENLRTLASQAQNATSAMDVTTTSRQFQMLTSQIKAAGMAGNDLFTRIVNMGKKFAQWYGVSQIFMRAISLIRQAVTNVKDLDSAMVSLKKVTDESSTTYNRFFENAAKSAKDLSVKMTDLIEQTAEWAKLGKSLQSSETLSKASAVYQIVGEVDSKTAVKDLIAAQKAFSLSDNEVMGIVDRMNNLSNKYAVSAADLGAGLKNAAAALALGGSDISKTLALIVGGTEITQDSEKTANAIKILTLRLRGKMNALR